MHLLCDGRGVPLAVTVIGGHQLEVHNLPSLLKAVDLPSHGGRPPCRPRQLVADRGYDAQALRQQLRRRGIRAMIPSRRLAPGKRRRQRGPRPRFDARLYAQRNVIERLIGRLKDHRRIATRFDKLDSTFIARIKLAFTRILLKRYFADRP